MLGFFFLKIIYIYFFSDSAYRKYLTATYSYDYGNGGGSDYDQISAANPATTAMTPVTGRQIILTNYPIANREDNKAVPSLIWSEYFFFHLMGRVCSAFFYAGSIQIFIQMDLYLVCGALFVLMWDSIQIFIQIYIWEMWFLIIF